jgi:diacylglycerol O-acyltransferase / wax synthase
VARLHSRRLDLSKPLWEVYVIEGLENIPGPPPGSFALYMKFHHSLFDGESATEVTTAIHALTPDAPVVPEGGRPVRYADRDPTGVEIFGHALAHNFLGWPKLGRFALRTATDLLKTGASATAANPAKLLGVGKSLLKGDLNAVLPTKPPATRFGARVSPHRVFDAVGLSLAEIKTIRQQVPGVTVTDVFMAVVGGGIRRYLSAKKELPETSMIAAVPMSLRGADKAGEGNRIGFTLMSVHSTIHCNGCMPHVRPARRPNAAVM